MVDERRNGTRKRQDRAMTGKDPVILRKNRRPRRRPLVAAPPGDVIDHGLPFYGIENVDLHKADTDPLDHWRLRMSVSTFGWLFERRRAVQI